MFIFFYFFRFLNFFKGFQWQGLIGPLLILIILSMMVLPLPGFILDIFFTFNISFSIIILLVSMFNRSTLEFSVFPTVILFSTLLRLALNVASTRTILLHGHTGLSAAGHVIKAFGNFIVGGDFSIGIVIFIILVIINFVVITKGAGRISEVGARFILDAMPGKQMSIDADLNSGLINKKEAKKKRLEISQEANFYGSMDGASKFIRGDAIASILIMFINIIGGLIVGLIRHSMSLFEAGKVYTLLTIGDGLVAQIPALVISTATGVIVTRVSTDQNISEQMISQIFFNPKIIILSGLVIGVLGIIPGMPNIIFLSFTILLFFIAWYIYNSKKNISSLSLEDSKNNNYSLKESKASWNDVVLEHTLTLELGNFLFSVLNFKKNNDFVIQMDNIRKKVAQEIGFLPPLINIKNNSNLSSSVYRILIRGVEYLKNEIFFDKLMALNSGNAFGILLGKKVIEPIFGFQAFWIDKDKKKQAKNQNYTIFTPKSLILYHIDYIVFSHLCDIFGRKDFEKLLDFISLKIPKLIEELIPNLITLTVFYKVLKNLLFENIPIRDMNTIFETLIEHGVSCKEPNQLTALVRLSLKKMIVQKFFSNENKIYVIGLEKKIECIFFELMKSDLSEVNLELSNLIFKSVKNAIKKQKIIKAPLVLLVNHSIRFFVSFFLRNRFAQLNVLSNLEIPESKIIKITSLVKK